MAQGWITASFGPPARIRLATLAPAAIVDVTRACSHASRRDFVALECAADGLIDAALVAARYRSEALRDADAVAASAALTAR
jgi:hypothetical protein